MVNELNKLNEIITSLEDQAKQVSEFNGVLNSIKQARDVIDSSKAELENSSNKLALFLQESKGDFERFGEIIGKIDISIKDNKEELRRVSEKVTSLDVLTSVEFRDKISLINHSVAEIKALQQNTLDFLTSLDTLTSVEFSETIMENTKTFKELINGIEQKIESTSLQQQQSIKKMNKIISVLIIITLGTTGLILWVEGVFNLL